MSLLVTGSIAIDTLQTPLGRAENVLGGSAIYFALAAAHFSPVRVVATVGEDFDMDMLEPLRDKSIDLGGIEVRAGSKTFRWHGKYVGAMNEAETVDVELNVLAERGAPIPPAFADSRFVFFGQHTSGLATRIRRPIVTGRATGLRHHEPVDRERAG